MRSDQDKQLIVDSYSDAISVRNVLTEQDISELVSIFNTSTKTHKNTGPITVDIDQRLIDDSIGIQKVLSSAKQYIGNFTVSAGLYFRVDFPHIIHNDDTYAFPQTYKAITIPLELYWNDRQPHEYPSLCIFDQYYLDGPSKFFNGETSMISNYNSPIYEYSGVCNKSSRGIPIMDRVNYLSHIRPKWLEGLTLNSTHSWVPGNIIIFDSTKLHCASDFRKLGYSGKLGLSIFTKRD